MRTEEFKEDLKKDKRLKADTVNLYLSIASDIEKAYELELDDVVSDDRLMEIVICDHLLFDSEASEEKIKVLKRYYRFANKRAYKASTQDSEVLKAADAVTRLLDGYDELRMSYAGAIYAEDKDTVSLYLMDEDIEPIWMGFFPTRRLAFISAMHYVEFFGKALSDFAFVDAEGELITMEAVMDFVNMLGGEDALDALEEYLKE